MFNIDIGRSPNTLNLRVYGRSNPEAKSYWDSNWLRCTANASTGAFRGTVEWQLRNEDLARFTQALDAFDDREEAGLDTLDGWLDVRVIRNEQGHIEARCQLMDNSEGGTSLEFRLPLDQIAVSELLGQLREVLAHFPVTGESEITPM